MMTIKNLAYFCVLAAVATACDVKQDLGETAGETEGGSGSAGTSTTGAGTGVLDTGPGEESGNLTESTSGDTGVVDTGPVSETGDSTVSATGGETETGGEMCEQDDTLLRWSSQSFVDGLGAESEFTGSGDCTVTEVPSDVPEGLGLQLQCTLSGTADGAPVVDQAYTLALDFTKSDAPTFSFPTFAPSVHLRVVVVPAGLELLGERHIVLEQPMLPDDGFAPVLIATDAHSVAPSPFLYADWHEGDWFAGPSFASAEGTCETGDAPDCSIDVALEGGWLDTFPVSLSGGQQGVFGAPTGEDGYAFHLEAAWQAVQGECPPDFPGTEYRFVALPDVP